MTSYVPFAYECLFEKGKWPDEVEYVLELPEDTRVQASAGWYMRRGRATWRHNAPFKIKRSKIIRDGKPFVKHSIILPKWQDTDKRSLINYVVPVGIRDRWKGTVGRYSGMHNLAFNLSTKLTEGVRKAFYYAKWNGGRQEPQELELRVVRVPEVQKSLERIVSIVSLNPFKAEKNPGMIQSLKRIGVNGIAGGSPKEWGPGMRYYATWVNFPMYHSSDPEAFAMGIDGKRQVGGSTRCMTYRGPDWKKYMTDLFKKIDNGYNVYMFDDVRPTVCYDNKCKAEFANMLKEHTQLDYLDPSDFMKPGWSGPKIYKELWHDFQIWIYGDAAQEMKNEMIEYAKNQNITDGVYFLQSSSPVSPAHSFAHAKTTEAFDFGGTQAYIYCYYHAYQGSPKQIGRRLNELQKKAGDYSNALVPTLSPGLTYMHPANSLDPHEQMKYQILEAAMAPKFSGYNIYSGRDIDLGDLRNIAAANEILSRFEDIFIDGEVVQGVSASGANTSARLKKLGGDILLLVADYSTYQNKETEVAVNLPIKITDKLIDVETGEEIACKSDGQRVPVKLSDRRARLFYGKEGMQ